MRAMLLMRRFIKPTAVSQKRRCMHSPKLTYEILLLERTPFKAKITYADFTGNIFIGTNYRCCFKGLRSAFLLNDSIVFVALLELCFLTFQIKQPKVVLLNSYVGYVKRRR